MKLSLIDFLKGVKVRFRFSRHFRILLFRARVPEKLDNVKNKLSSLEF